MLILEKSLDYLMNSPNIANMANYINTLMYTLKRHLFTSSRKINDKYVILDN